MYVCEPSSGPSVTSVDHVPAEFARSISVEVSAAEVSLQRTITSLSPVEVFIERCSE